jgi:hypothetical protein
LLRLDQNHREAWLGGLHRFVFFFSRQGKTAKTDPQADHPDTFLHDLRAFLHLAGSVSIAHEKHFHLHAKPPQVGVKAGQ